MTHPRVPKDLALAPVAVAIDQNLRSLRDATQDEIDLSLQLQLDSPPRTNTREERAARVLQTALRFVDTHDWHAQITDDGARLRLSGGSVTLDLGLSAALMRYIEGGVGSAGGESAAAVPGGA
jgi:hypothetical protein